MVAKPTILFVPGAWHSKFHAAPALPYFQKAGYTVQVLTLANLGLHPDKDPKPSTQDSVAKILRAMETEAHAGRDFILLAHSAGGLVSAMAVNEFLASKTIEGGKARLKHIIFLASFIHTSKHIISHWHLMDFEKGISTVLNPAETFYNDMAPAAAQPFCDALQPMTLSPRPDDVDSAWHAVPRTFIVCAKDRAILAEKQREEAGEQGMRVVEMESGHCPFVSCPGEFVGGVDVILRG